MKEWIVKAEYHVIKELVVTTKDDADPLDPGTWLDVDLDERDLDCSLWDTISAEPNV